MIVSIFYMIACIFFIRGIKLLGKTETARKGNFYSAIGMLIAVIVVLFEKDVISAGVSAYLWIAVAIAIGSLIGLIWAKKVEMTGMPELVALFNGFGGLSSLLVALSEYSLGKETDIFTAITLGLTIARGRLHLQVQ